MVKSLYISIAGPIQPCHITPSFFRPVSTPATTSTRRLLFHGLASPHRKFIVQLVVTERRQEQQS